MLIENTNISNMNIISTIKLPNAPTIGTVTILSSTSANVSFTQPNYDGGLPITSYTAVSSPGGITATLNQSDSGTITVTGLTKNTSYTFTVYATNIVGNGLSSSSSVSKTTLPDIGDSYGGGYFAGQISTTANGIATHNLVIAPKSSGWSSYSIQHGSFISSTDGRLYGPFTGATSRIDGPGNTSYLKSQGTGYIGDWADNLVINGYSDWYLPAIDELEIIYYNFRPTVPVAGNYNYTSNPINQYSVPIRSTYTNTNPGQTIATAFRTGGLEVLDDRYVWSSTYSTVDAKALTIFFDAYYSNAYGWQYPHSTDSAAGRAVRRVPV